MFAQCVPLDVTKSSTLYLNYSFPIFFILSITGQRHRICLSHLHLMHCVTHICLALAYFTFISTIKGILFFNLWSSLHPNPPPPPPQGRSGADGGRGMPGESGGKVKKALSICWCHIMCHRTVVMSYEVSPYSGDVIWSVTVQWWCHMKCHCTVVMS